MGVCVQQLRQIHLRASGGRWRGEAGHGRVDGDVFGTVVSRDIIGMCWYSKTKLGTCCKRHPSLNILTVQARSLAALVGQVSNVEVGQALRTVGLAGCRMLR